MPVIMSAVSIMSFTPTGMPSMTESWVAVRQRAAEASAEVRAFRASITVKAPTSDSRRSISARHSSSTCTGESAPSANEAMRLTYGRRCGRWLVGTLVPPDTDSLAQRLEPRMARKACTHILLCVWHHDQNHQGGSSAAHCRAALRGNSGVIPRQVFSICWHDNPRRSLLAEEADGRLELGFIVECSRHDKFSAGSVLLEEDWRATFGAKSAMHGFATLTAGHREGGHRPGNGNGVGGDLQSR